jgi:2-dehydro-3-deoxyphosphogluconate aldolase/(4S)-4-hydroxy-2-oxoglutarate aldolase
MDGPMIGIISAKRIVPVITISDSAKATDLADCLVEAGLPIAEITLRTPEGIKAIERAATNTSLLVGAGSLRNAEDAKGAIAAGARFLVSAGFSKSIALEATRNNVQYFPGVATPTEIIQALDAGINTVKFFPAETLGGLAALKAFSAPFPGVGFMPTGGITPTNAATYLEFPPVLAVGGTWMVAKELIDRGDFSTISQLVSEAVRVCER